MGNETAIVKRGRPKGVKNDEQIELPAVIDNVAVFSENAVGIIGFKQDRLQEILVVETAIAQKIERLKAKIAMSDDKKELDKLQKQFKRSKAITGDLRRSIAVTMEDDLHHVPGKDLYEKINYLSK